MKRILTLILVLALALAALTSCAVVDTVKGWFGGEEHEHSFVEGKCECGEVDPDYKPEPPAPEVDEDLQLAYDFVKNTYKDLSATPSSFEIVMNAPIGEKIFPITWTTSLPEQITITEIETEDGNFYLVNVPDLPEEAINYTLNFSVQNEAGEKKEGSFNLTVPQYRVSTHEEYVNAEDGTPLVIQGIVTGIYSKSTNSKSENSLIIQDVNGNGGYYAYQLAEDPAGVISVGMTVEVKGYKKNHYGTHELTSPSVRIVDASIKSATALDFTEAVIAAASLDAAQLVNKSGTLVTLTGVTLLDYNESKGYHNFQIGNHKAYLRVSSSSNMITKAEGETVTETFKANFYNKADVTGVITIYDNAIYLMPVSSAPFANITEQEKPADVKVDVALQNTTIPSCIQFTGNTNLPTAFSGFEDVAISWELVGESTIASVANNVLTVSAIPEEAQTVTLKATAVCDNNSDSKEYTITVKSISTITIARALEIGYLCSHNQYTEELYYIVGVVDYIADTQYGNMDIKDGDLSIYIHGLYDSTGKIRYDAMTVQPLVKDTIKVLSSIGKYNNDVQLKNAKVIEHTVHPDNVVEQAPEIEFKPVNPIVGTEFFFGMTKNDVVYYITGSMGTGNSQYYMASTAKQADAAKVTVVAGPTEGTYYLTVVVDGATKYLDLVVSGTHKNAVYADAAPEVGLSFDAETKTFYKELDGANYTFGTALSNNYTTIGGVQVSADNAMLQISFAAEHTCTFTDVVVTAPTCEEQGYTTHTCVCGNVVVDTYVDALQHAWGEDGVCTNEGCGASNHDHEWEEVVTAPTCTEAGYTTKTCTVDGCTKTEVIPGEAALGHSYTDGVCNRDNCGAIDPDHYFEMTISEVNAAADNTKVKVTGTVIRIDSAYNSQYDNITLTIKDETGATLYCYRITGNWAVNDIITVTGVKTTHSSAPQIAQGATAEKIGVHECTNFTEATCKKLAACTLCGKETGELAEHTMVEGVCSVCGHKEGAAEVVTNKATMAYTGSTTTNMTGNNDAATLGLDATIFTVIGNKGSTNNNCGLNKNGNIRLYGSSSNGNGSYFTVTTAEGYTIQSIKITFVNSTNNKNCQLTVDGTSTVFDGSSTTWEVDINSNSFELKNIITGSTTQIHIASIEITYVVPQA